jgi:hypothetical protein
MLGRSNITSSTNKNFNKAILLINPSERFDDYKSYLVIPNAGCIGCISNAETFVLEKIDILDSVRIVFTAFKFKKQIRTKLGERIYIPVY